MEPSDLLLVSFLGGFFGAIMGIVGLAIWTLIRDSDDDFDVDS